MSERFGGWSVAKIARRLQVSWHTVAAWIEAGELAAINLAKPGSTPRWRVQDEAVKALLERRTSGAKREPVSAA